MGKTYEALLKAEKDKQERSRWEKTDEPIPGHPQSVDLPFQMAEEYHRLKYRVIHIFSDKKGKALLFVGPAKGDGNSTILSHYAVLLASEGDRVLLVDGNLKSPSIHGIFDLDLENGFSELILQKSPLEEVIKRTRFPNLQVITAGNTHPDPFSAVTLKFLDSCIARMKSKAEWVLLDAPPIDSYNDALALAPKMDGVVMVIQAEKTRWEVAQSAKQKMETGHANILGVVLNKRRFHIPEWLYRRLR